jgi:hypothetical protein
MPSSGVSEDSYSVLAIYIKKKKKKKKNLKKKKKTAASTSSDFSFNDFFIKLSSLMKQGPTVSGL